MLISSITYKVAFELTSSTRWELCDFVENAKRDTYMVLAHYNFYYSYPCFGTKWKGDKNCEYHKVETKCHYCDWKPERNFGGIGNMYLLLKAANERMILLCPTHAKNYHYWKDKTIITPLAKPIYSQGLLF